VVDGANEGDARVCPRLRHDRCGAPAHRQRGGTGRDCRRSRRFQTRLRRRRDGAPPAHLSAALPAPHPPWPLSPAPRAAPARAPLPPRTPPCRRDASPRARCHAPRSRLSQNLDGEPWGIADCGLRIAARCGFLLRVRDLFIPGNWEAEPYGSAIRRPAPACRGPQSAVGSAARRDRHLASLTFADRDGEDVGVVLKGDMNDAPFVRRHWLHGDGLAGRSHPVREAGGEAP
jgi:hypothetical protein